MEGEKGSLSDRLNAKIVQREVPSHWMAHAYILTLLPKKPLPSRESRNGNLLPELSRDRTSDPGPTLI